MHALIIDDEKHCRDSLSITLSQCCPEVEVLALCSNANAALEAIVKYQPDLVFLDIELPGMNGFELLENCGSQDFGVIFTTAYNEYAIRAFRHNALDYLLKPIDKTELLQAVGRALNKKKSGSIPSSLPRSVRKTPGRVALPTLEGLTIVDTKDIIYCESEDSYTRIHLTDDKDILVSKTLKKVEALLANEPDFFRSHHSFMINLLHIQRYLKGDGGYVVLSNAKVLPVSRVKKNDLLQLFEKL